MRPSAGPSEPVLTLIVHLLDSFTFIHPYYMINMYASVLNFDVTALAQRSDRCALETN